MSLQKIYPNLTLFSDLNWDEVSKEFEAEYSHLSFPEYLQQKADDGDAPLYLFEIAFYEMALYQLETMDEEFELQEGYVLNPTALFLSLEYDVVKMIEEAKSGTIRVIDYPHVLGIYRDTEDQIHAQYLSDEKLALLEALEDGAQSDESFVPEDAHSTFVELLNSGLILEVSE